MREGTQLGVDAMRPWLRSVIQASKLACATLTCTLLRRLHGSLPAPSLSLADAFYWLAKRYSSYLSSRPRHADENRHQLFMSEKKRSGSACSARSHGLGLRPTNVRLAARHSPPHFSKCTPAHTLFLNFICEILRDYSQRVSS